MANNIVQLNVSVTNPPAPSKLLRTGALISQGGTNTSANTLSLLTQASDLTPLLNGAVTITAATWSTGTVTVTTSTPHGIPSGDTVQGTIAGMTPTGYNGTFALTYVSANQFSYPLVSNPGTATIFGSMTLADVAELVSMATTFFAQGKNASVYVLELGTGTPAQGVTALASYLTANPNTIFSFLVPREWDGEATFKTNLLALYNSPSSLVKFFVTTTISTYAAYSPTYSCAFLMVEAPGIPSTEFSCAAAFYVTLNYNPSSSNPVSPLCFSFLYGVTAYPTADNSALLSTLKTANVNYVDTGAEGGLSNTLLKWGHMLDGNPFNYWYTVAWAIVNLDLDLSNEVINGSNNAIAPLYYNQFGIDRVQNRGAKTLRNGASYGLILGQIIVTKLAAADFAANVANGLYAGNAVINAEPFTVYNSENPSDYSIGKYAGLSAAITPARGFEQIVMNIQVTNFVA